MPGLKRTNRTERALASCSGTSKSTPRPGQVDLAGRRVAADAAELGLPGPWSVASSRGFLIEGPLDR